MSTRKNLDQAETVLAIAEEVGAIGQAPAEVPVICPGAATDVPHEGIRAGARALLVHKAERLTTPYTPYGAVAIHVSLCIVIRVHLLLSRWARPSTHVASGGVFKFGSKEFDQSLLVRFGRRAP
ncbi:MAG TPA: hypothetical protein VG055_31285 [Planctomycetaceae bacterium]|nr:hypothetical protein [Planctomycetaceae bacterium]